MQKQKPLKDLRKINGRKSRKMRCSDVLWCSDGYGSSDIYGVGTFFVVRTSAAFGASAVLRTFEPFRMEFFFNKSEPLSRLFADLTVNLL